MRGTASKAPRALGRALGRTLALLAGAALAWACSDEPVERPPIERPIERPALAVPLPSPPPTERRVVEVLSDAAAAVAAAPESADSWGRLGMLLDAHGYLSEAATCYRRALELAPGDFRWSYHLAIVLDLEAAPGEEVVGLFSRAAEAEPDYPPTYYRLSVALQRRGQLERARNAVQRALDLDPNLAIAWRQLGQVHLAQGDPSRAIGALRESLERAPDDSATLSLLAQALRRAGDDEAARWAASRARRSSGDATLPDPVRSEVASLGVSANRAYERGQEALRSGNLDQAIELLAIKQEVSPGPSSSHLLGVAHRRAGRPEEAIRFFELAIEMNDHPSSHWQLGELLIEQGREPLGVEHLRLARDLASGDGASGDGSGDGASDDARLLHATGAALARNGHLDDAIEAFAAAAATDRHNASLETDWCGALLQQGELDEAVLHCRRALELDEASPRAHLHMGLVLESGGRRAEALPHYRRAVELDPTSRAAELLARPVPGAGGLG